MSETPETGDDPRSPHPAPGPSARTISRAAGLTLTVVTTLGVVLLGLALLPTVRQPLPPPKDGIAAVALPPSPPLASRDAMAVAEMPPSADRSPGAQGGGTAAPPAAEPRAIAATTPAPGGAPSDAAPGTDPSAKPADPFEHRARVPSEKQAASEASDGGAKTATRGEDAGGSPSAQSTADGREDREPADCSASDREIAREAWRRNWPIVCPAGGGERASIFIPLKGTLDGETHETRRRPDREVRINMPAAESLLTLRQYKVRRLAFVDLKVLAWEGKAHGTKLRIKLQPGADEPAIDIKDGYAKITVETPAPGTD